MTNQSHFRPGDVILCFDTLWNAFLLLNQGLQAFPHPQLETESLDSLSKLVEAIVIHERRFATKSSFKAAESLKFSHKEIISELPIDSHFTNLAYSKDDVMTRIDSELDEIEKRLTEATPLNNKKAYKEDMGRSWEFLSQYHARMTYLYACNYGLSFRTTVQPLSLSESNELSFKEDEFSVYSDAASAIIGSVHQAVDTGLLNRSQYLGDYFKLEMPLILNYVLTKAKIRQDIIPIALEVRESKEARAFREQLSWLDSATAIGDDLTVGSIIDEISDKVQTLGKKLGQGSIDMDIAFPQSLSLNIGQISKLIWNEISKRRKRYLFFVEDLYKTGVHARPIQRHLGKLL